MLKKKASKKKKTMKFGKSLLFKNVAINLVIIVILVATIVTMSYEFSSDAITREVETQMQLKLEESKNKILSIRKNQEKQLTILSRSLEVTSAFGNNDKLEQMDKIANELIDNYAPYMENVLLVDAKGIVIYDSNKNSMVGQDLSSRSYFQECMKGKNAHSGILVSKATSNYVEAISVPIVKNFKVIGAFVTSMNINYIRELLKDVKIKDSGYAFLLDENGVFMYHPNKELINTKLSDLNIKELNDVLPDMLARKEGKTNFTYEEKEKIDLYIPIDRWSLSINAVKSEYLSGVNKMLTDILGVGAIMLVVAFIAAGLNSFLMIRRVKKVQHVMENVAHGNMTVEVEEKNLKKCWEMLNCDKTECPAYHNPNLKCWEMSGTFCRDMIQGGALTKLEDCKQCKVYQKSEGDELSQMTRGLSMMVKTMRDLIYNIAQISEQLTSSSQELSSASQETTMTAESISTRMEEVSANSESQIEYAENINESTMDMNGKLVDSVARINHMEMEAEKVNQRAKVGEEKIGFAIKGMGQINEQTGKIQVVMEDLSRQSEVISEINNVITSIAEQTNLLSLNASIEAARAGEEGKGFAVVADQIRKLAAQSQTSVKNIADQISQIRESITSAGLMMQAETEYVQNGISLVQESKLAFEDIANRVYELVNGMSEVVDFVKTVQNSSNTVSESIQKIAGVIEESGADIEEVTASTEEQTSISEEISRAATELSNMAGELLKAVSVFKV